MSGWNKVALADHHFPPINLGYNIDFEIGPILLRSVNTDRKMKEI